MYDSHLHLTIEPLASNIERHLMEFKEAGGTNILNVSYDIQSITDVISQSIKYENSYPDMIQTGIGIHPEHVIEQDFNMSKSIEYLEENLSLHRKRINAIGECGLDYYHLKFVPNLTPEQIEENHDIQKNMFRKHIEIALTNNLPLSIHIRDEAESNMCSADGLKIVASTGKGNARGVFHSYTGTIDYLNEILNLGFYVGFNGIVTYPKAQNVRDILIATPLNKILVETDAPLLPPQKVRNGKSGDVKYGKPVDVIEIVQTIAKVKEVSEEKCWETLKENYKNLFLSN